MKKITLIGTAASSPLIQQVGRKETALLRIAVNKADFKGDKMAICDTPALVTRARLHVTQGTHVAIEGEISATGRIFVLTMLIMK